MPSQKSTKITEQQEDALPTETPTAADSPTSTDNNNDESILNQHEESTSTITITATTTSLQAQFDKNISKKSNVTIDNAADNNIAATTATDTIKESIIAMSTSTTTDNSKETQTKATIIPTKNKQNKKADLSPSASSTTLTTFQHLIPTQHHSPRKLPPKEINESNIADRYIEFIFYCNPSAPIETDVSSLQRAFQAVPKSDGKVFHPYVLFQLVCRHEQGEIKTWTKLAQQLGVEKTDESSPQKIQQYAVRLKKWMRSIHLDAFFDYLLSKPNEYYLEPHKNPTGTEETTTSTTAAIDDDADDADLVLKLIKRANSKRKKRKYTRQPQQLKDDSKEKSTTSSSKATRNEERPEKRIKVAFSEASSGNDDEDDAAEPIEEDLQDIEGEDPDLRIARRRSIVQVGVGPRWVKDEEEEEYKYEDGNGTEASSSASVATSKHKDATNKKKAASNNSRSNNNNKSSSSKNNASTRISSAAPAREILLHLGKSKPFDHIPTPNPSPTAEMRYHHQHPGHSSLSSVAGFDRNTVDSSSTASGNNTQNIKWRTISIGGGPSVAQVSTSSSLQKGIKRKHSVDVSPTGHYDTFLTSNSPDAVTTLTERLTKAVEMLEKSHRRIEQLENSMRQHDEEFRRKFNEMKNDMVGLLKRWGD
ncbi:10578_t:CDS:2 [Ambispora leptoticha]|uniref:10578_t:CDS:1 n=1 Tax=Ambispora leptoticha TaxID=144679 RepID=A0A9N9FM44_9GLOM|nr:10578_t:CDS:2 [Ambispora leptoticha]